MDPVVAFWHVVNGLMPGVGVAVWAVLLAKAVWRRRLASVAWRHLLAWTVGAGVLAQLSGLVVMGRDGTMAGYGLLALAVAAALWWAGLRGR
ncbi:hypothetical protein [Ideonella livida]|uniref:Uncharacterized protein n=1 Tax=Ideonella livida TaxID=2707176 RepID=A0A7C9PJ31_9BURK|nr:hypothetical protein [Ideonella livida]NDY93068.1 hypothetical protein [Ideonella livida]